MSFLGRGLPVSGGPDFLSMLFPSPHLQPRVALAWAKRNNDEQMGNFTCRSRRVGSFL